MWKYIRIIILVITLLLFSFALKVHLEGPACNSTIGLKVLGLCD